MGARLESGLLFEPAREVVLIEETELFTHVFDEGFFSEQADGFLEELGIAVFAEGLSGGPFENPVQIIRLVSHLLGENGNFRQGSFALIEEPLEPPDEGGDFPAPCRKVSGGPQQGVQNAQDAGGHQKPTACVGGIGYPGQFRELPLDAAGLGLAQAIEGKPVLHSSPPVQIEDEAKRAAPRCLAERMHAVGRQECDRGRAGFVVLPGGRHESRSAQVAEDLGEGMGMLGKHVHLGQVAVHAQPPNPQSRQPDIDFLKEQGAGMLHETMESANKTKRKSFLCYILPCPS